MASPECSLVGVARTPSFAALNRARAAHRARIAHLDPGPARDSLATEFLRRAAAADVRDAAQRVTVALEELAPAEARDILIWFLAEGEVGWSPVVPLPVVAGE